jgi:hypothetical protein
VTVYGVRLFLVAAMVSVVCRYAVAEGLVRQDITDRDIQIVPFRDLRRRRRQVGKA